MPFIYERWMPQEVILNPWVASAPAVSKAPEPSGYAWGRRYGGRSRRRPHSYYTPPPPAPRFQRTDVPYGMGATNDVPAAANAFAAAFVADIESAPPLKAALLRRQIGRAGLTRIVMRDLDSVRMRRTGPALFPNLRVVAREFLAQEARKTSGRPADGMGQWDAIAGVIGAAAGAAANIYSSVTNADMQKQLLKLQEQRNTAAIQVAQLQAKTAQTQLAQANVAATGVPSSSPIATVLQAVGGWPVVGIATGAIALAVGTYFAFKGR